MKNIVLALLLVLLSATAAEAATDSGKARQMDAGKARQRVGIAAVVNDEVVTFSDVTNRVRLYLTGAKQPPAEALRKMEKEILSRLIDEKLQLQEAKDLGITVTDEQVKEGFAEIAQKNKLPADEFRQRLQSAGVKVDTLYDQLRAEIAWSQVIRRKLRPQVNVSESEIDSQMDRIVRASGKNEFRVAEIFLAVPDAKDEMNVREDADKIVKQITKGASFSQIAREFSQAPGASTGGDIGWIQEGQLDAALDNALSKMQPGQVSPPIRTAKGFHILFLRDVRQNAVVSSSSGAPAAPQAAPAAPVEAAPADTIVHLKQIVIPVGKTDPQPIVNAKIVRAQSLSAEIKSCEQMETKAKDFIFDGTGDLGKVSMNALQDPIKTAVAGLPAQTLSQPVRLENAIAVLMVCDRTDVGGTPVAAVAPAPAPAAPAPVVKNDEASREKIATRIGQERLTQLQERYLRDLRATAFIDKRF